MPNSSDSQPLGAWLPQESPELGFGPLADQIAFPRLTEAEIEDAASFGERCSFTRSQPLFCAGDYPFNSHVILSGTVRVVDCSTGVRTVFVRYGAGYFTGDIDLF